jgi:hypothetical protein
MPLTDLQIKNFRPEPGKKQRLFDGHGLYLEISPTGGTYWRWKYTLGGRKDVSQSASIRLGRIVVRIHSRTPASDGGTYILHSETAKRNGGGL